MRVGGEVDKASNRAGRIRCEARPFLAIKLSWRPSSESVSDDSLSSWRRRCEWPNSKSFYAELEPHKQKQSEELFFFMMSGISQSFKSMKELLKSYQWIYDKMLQHTESWATCPPPAIIYQGALFFPWLFFFGASSAAVSASIFTRESSSTKTCNFSRPKVCANRPSPSLGFLESTQPSWPTGLHQFCHIRIGQDLWSSLINVNEIFCSWNIVVRFWYMRID